MDINKITGKNMVYYPTIDTCANSIGAGELCGWMGGWGGMILAVSFIIFLFYSVVYMLAFALQSEELKRSAKSHFYDAIFTIMLTMSIILLLVGSTGTGGGIFGMIQNYFGGATVSCDIRGTINLGAGASPFEVIKCRLMEKASFVSEIYESVYVSAREPFKQFSMIFGIMGLPVWMSGTYSWNDKVSDLYSEIEGYRLLASVCVSLLIGINGYISAINYIEMNMLRMFLPIGLVLRAIPFTRNVGAFFIAIAIGFYVIFPFLFVITDPGYVKIPIPKMDITDESVITLPFPSFRGAVAMLTMTPMTQTGSAIFSTLDIRSAAAELSRLYYGLLLQPVIILSITLIFIKYIMSFLGGETQELYRLASKVI